MSQARTDVPDNANAHCPGTSSEEAGRASACEGCPNRQICATAPKGPDPDLAAIAARMSRVKHKILVLSGKGGVGKSTFSAQLAFALAAEGKEVGLLDIDICGPSVPKMLGLEGQGVHQSASGWSPVYVEDNLAVMSIGFLVSDPDEAVIWRGPKKNAIIKQFVRDVDWGDLDYLVVDAPPGTSDEHITIAQCLGATSGADGAVIVTTPQEVAIIDVRKEINFCRKVGLQVLGVVENMSGLIQRVPELRFSYAPAAVCCDPTQGPNGDCPLDVTQHVLDLLRTQFQDIQQLVVHSEIFQPTKGGAAKMCEDMGVALLGRVPLDPALARAAEEGRPVLHAQAQGQQQNANGSKTVNTSTAVSLPALQTIVKKLLQQMDAAAQT